MTKKTDFDLDASTHQLFTLPEGCGTLLGQLEQDLTADPALFMSIHLQSTAKPMFEMEQVWAAANIPDESTPVDNHVEDLMRSLVAHASNTSSPSFIGHMTSALPQFLLPLSKLMTALNQNVVKVETSDSFTPMERQVMAMMHHLTYGLSDEFYSEWMHNPGGSLGAFCSGGTVANITALWNARNLLFKPEGEFNGVAEEGMAAALRYKNYEGIAVLVSERAHYSLSKAADLLGLGRSSFVAIPTDSKNKIRTDLLAEKCQELCDSGIKVMSIVGIAGTTETGSVDPLNEIADLAEEYESYFHVDAAWGGATLMSERNRKLMDGIERADSVTIDAHKQMYVPMGAGMVVFRDPQTANAIEHHANYILRRGSMDLGRHTLEGSRPGMAMLVHACLSIIGRKGYESLIDESIDKARYFAGLIDDDPCFELVTEPELCLLTYRYVPAGVMDLMADLSADLRRKLNEKLNQLTIDIQTRQSDAGQSFVSRTSLNPLSCDGNDTIVFRVVLANPLTTKEILQAVLQEQKEIAQSLEASVLALIGQIEPAAMRQAG